MKITVQLIGPRRSGKTTAAAIIANALTERGFKVTCNAAVNAARADVAAIAETTPSRLAMRCVELVEVSLEERDLVHASRRNNDHEDDGA